ncbi:MAG: YegP family protein [Methylophilaceae bacterium]
MYFEIYQQLSGLLSSQWRWRLKAANHEPIASGESYHKKSDCLHAIGLIRGTNSNTPIYEV